MEPTPLPIDPLLPEIVETLRREGALVLEAPPGAGKTTRVPRALLEAGIAGDREVVVLQPRRLATRLAAQRVAEELGERLGERVGYQVRFEDVSGPRTRLRFVTEGVLNRQLLSDPKLARVGVVVLDEFHERHLATDLALAWLTRLRRTTRSDLKLVVMSATLEAAPVAAYLGDCPVLRSEGRRFAVEIEHLPAVDPRPLETQVLAALKHSLVPQRAADMAAGHWLVFLPGAAEIRRAKEACEPFAARHNFDILPLHGDLPAAEQDRAVRPGPRRTIILSTNVAETSVTIDGVLRVVDSGIARQAVHSPWSGLPSLQIRPISKASARQRAGRAGRTGLGRCTRLYTRTDFEGRPDHDVPEIRRMDLTETVLTLRASGVNAIDGFPFLEPPPAAALEAAEALLRRLGAVEAEGDVTPLGRALLAYPLHPRLARLVVEAHRRGAGDDGVAVAALLSERDVRSRARAHFASGGRAAPATRGLESDVLEVWSLFREAEGMGLSSRAISSLGLDGGAVHAAARVQKQLGRILHRQPGAGPAAQDVETALGLAVLAAFPDRVARRRKPGAPEILLMGGTSAALAETSAVHQAELMVAVDAEETRRGIRVRQASAVEPEWLLELFPGSVQDEDALVWNAAAGRVERVTRLAYGELALEETRTLAPPSEQASALLQASAISLGPARWIGSAETVGHVEARLEWAAQANPGLGLPAPDAFWSAALGALAEGKRSLAELAEAPILEVALGLLSAPQRRALETSAPERVALPSGRSLVVHYETAQPPWVESRLQDFFGLAQGPTLGEKRLPLVLHLLAPNGRDVQVTTDLAGFWSRHYPALRRELSRRYPRHPWPEDPLTAQPPVPGARRPR